MDYDTWMIWAEETGINSLVLSFLRQRGNFAGSTPDRWERISALLKAKPTVSSATLLRVCKGVVGDPGASAFYGFKQDVDAGRVQLPILGLILPKLL